MKKQKLKALVKKTRSTAQRDIKLNLITGLKAITDQLVTGSKMIDKAIKRDAKSLAKKIAKEMVIDEVALISADTQVKTEEQKPATNVVASPAKINQGKKRAARKPEKAVEV